MLALRSLPLRSIRHHWRGNLAVLFAAAVGAAVLAGALFVGDSLRGSLRAKSERQLNGVTAAWTGNRLIRTGSVAMPDTVPALMLQGSLANEDDGTTVPHVTIVGLTEDGFTKFGLKPPTARGVQAVLGARVAAKAGIKVGGKLRLSVQQFSSLPRSSIMGKRNAEDTTLGFDLTAADILPDDHAANDFNLLPNPAPPLNVYVPLEALQRRALGDNPDRVNALFAFGPDAGAVNAALERTLDLPDWGLRLRTRRDPPLGNKVPSRNLAYVSLETDRLLLEPTVLDAAESSAKELGLRTARTTAYLAIDIAHEKNVIPYSIVAAVEPGAAAPLGPFLPEGVPNIADDEIVLADWPESPLKTAKPGDTIRLKFFAPDVESGERTITADFKLRGYIPLAGPAADPALTPPFPGITDKLDIATWQPPFTFDRTRIRPGDVHDKFWKDYRTTPKAYVNRAAGEKWFSSRFGNVTSIRIAPAAGETPEQTVAKLTPLLRAKLTPASGGIVVEDVRSRLLAASKGGTDFGGLFLGFSLFLIVSALLLVGLMFRLNVERRAKEIGNYLAFGYSPRVVLRMLVFEGLLLAAIGAAVGVLAAVGYSRLLLALIADLWPDPGAKSFLRPHATPISAILGFVLTLVMTGLTVWLAVRKLVRVAPPSLLRGQIETTEPERPAERRWGTILIVSCVLGAVAALFGSPMLPNPDFRAMGFFLGGALLFVAGLLVVRRRLTAPRSLARSLTDFAVRNAGRAPGRSVLTVMLIGSATFLLVAVESFRRKPEADFAGRTGGSGGFNLLVESDVPLFNRLDAQAGRDDVLAGLDLFLQRQAERNPDADKKALVAAAKEKLTAIRVSVPVRVVSGDDASCLNLYQAGKPRLLGVPDDLIERGGFRFAMTASGAGDNPWTLLKQPQPDGAIPVFAEQNTAMWMLKIMVGGTVEVEDEQGKKVTCRLVGTLQDSPFQSELVMADDALRKLHPREEGFRLNLVATDGADAPEIAKLLAAGLQGSGVAVTESRERVAAFQAVVGTYLTTFQLLGGLGLLLGILGLAAVILRGVWERLGEIALLRAVGFAPSAVRRAVLLENLWLLALGVALGLGAAVLSVLPNLALGGSLPWAGVGILLVGVFATGIIVVVLAARSALRAPILTALRSE